MILRETQGRKRMEKELQEQQELVSALTAETMTLREAVAALQVGESIFKSTSVFVIRLWRPRVGTSTANKSCWFFYLSS